MNVEIANKLVTLRKTHGLSQEDLADKLGDLVKLYQNGKGQNLRQILII